MAKDPAFLFYTNDFLTGIADLTMEERGQYITLLCLQHQKGHLTNKMIRLCVGNATADVMQKFIKDADGNYYNERLDVEIAKRAEHSVKQRERAIEGWKKRNATANATALPLENANENINSIIKYKEFAHLYLTVDEFNRLIKDGFTKDEIDATCDAIENFKNNHKYNSLNLTLRNWIKADRAKNPIKQTNSVGMGRNLTNYGD